MLKEHGLVLNRTFSHIVMQEKGKANFPNHPARYLVSHITSCYQLLIATGLDNGCEKP